MSHKTLSHTTFSISHLAYHYPSLIYFPTLGGSYNLCFPDTCLLRKQHLCEVEVDAEIDGRRSSDGRRQINSLEGHTAGADGEGIVGSEALAVEDSCVPAADAQSEWEKDKANKHVVQSD